jgi:hypothetical protein
VTGVIFDPGNVSYLHCQQPLNRGVENSHRVQPSLQQVHILNQAGRLFNVAVMVASMSLGYLKTLAL